MHSLGVKVGEAQSGTQPCLLFLSLIDGLFCRSASLPTLLIAEVLSAKSLTECKPLAQLASMKIRLRLDSTS